VLWGDADAMKRLANTFDLLISTVPRAYPMRPFVNVLKPNATLVNVGAMEEPTGVTGINLVYARKSVAGSMIGGIAETQEVIDYCATRGIKADIELIGPEHISKAYDRVVKKDGALPLRHRHGQTEMSEGEGRARPNSRRPGSPRRAPRM
jgi:uncharacterized zinc-type alcohol dehydrogenase-like protein